MSCIHDSYLGGRLLLVDECGAAVEDGGVGGVARPEALGDDGGERGGDRVGAVRRVLQILAVNEMHIQGEKRARALPTRH